MTAIYCITKSVLYLPKYRDKQQISVVEILEICNVHFSPNKSSDRILNVICRLLFLQNKIRKPLVM